MNGMRRVIVALSAVAFLFLLPSGVTAQDEPAETVITLSSKPALDDRGHEVAGTYSLVAIVTTADGRYVPNRTVRFTENVQFFGARASTVGLVRTDDTGYAGVFYQPVETGSHMLTARFAGDTRYAATDATITLDVPEAIAPFAKEPLPLASVGSWLAWFLAVLGVAFWVVLLGVFVRTVRRLRAAPGRAGKPAMETAPAD